MGAKVVFKEYTSDQLTLLPYKLDELVPQGHPVRIVKDVIDQIDTKTEVEIGLLSIAHNLRKRKA